MTTEYARQKLLKTADASRYLGVSTKTLRQSTHTIILIADSFSAVVGALSDVTPNKSATLAFLFPSAVLIVMYSVIVASFRPRGLLSKSRI